MLTVGARLGPYEVVALAGAGGMGEVYRARDTRLERDVAIKVLPARLSSSPDLRARFEREARAISSLQHPHICTLFDVGHQDGTDFLVMEFLEGETLAERLKKGPLPLEQLFKAGIEIADALDKAHRQGILHRDLKPGNVMLTKSGAKLMDFGLAKSFATVGVAASGSSLPAFTAAATISSPASPLTAEGTVVGTFQYMSPEQVEGREADARSDIFAFGAVLYEMATGKRAFEGKSQLSVASAVLEKDPEPMSALAPMTPPALEHVVRTCLAKEPDERWQSAGDIARQLRWIADAGSQVGAPRVVASHRKVRERAAWAAAALLAVAALLLGLGYYRAATQPVHVTRAYINPPPETEFSLAGTHPGPVAISPDGRKLAFAGRDKNGRVLLLARNLESPVAVPLAGTEGAGYPFWSPDSRWIGFFAEGKLKKIESSGGPVLSIADATIGKGGAWNRDDVIVFTPAANTPLMRVSAAGGEARQVTTLAPGETSHRLPLFLPDGKHFLYLARRTGAADHGVMIGSLDGDEPQLLMPNGTQAAYASGHLLFLRQNMLLAQRFDAAKRKLEGEAIPIAEGVNELPAAQAALFTVSQAGALAFHLGSGGQGSVLTWVDREGKVLDTLGEPAAHAVPRLSPDGGKVAIPIFDGRSGTRDIWIYDVGRKLRSRFTFDPTEEQSPVWMPDSERIIYNSNRTGRYHIYINSLAGTGGEEPLLENEHDKFPLSVSLDGKFLLYIQRGATTQGDIWVLPLEGERKPYPFLQSAFDEIFASFSPDGRWVLYSSDESGRYEIYATRFPGPGRKWQVSNGTSGPAQWSSDGREILYSGPGGTLVSAPIEVAGESLRVGELQSFPNLSPGFFFAVSADGQRLLFPRTVGAFTSGHISLILNWPELLKEK